MREIILRKFGVSSADLIGEGGESLVYSLPGGKMLRIYRENKNTISHVQKLAAFYREIQGKFSFETPQILEIAEEQGILYSVAVCIQGRDMSKIFPTLGTQGKRKALQSYFKAMEEFTQVSFEEKLYGQFLATKPVNAKTWPDFYEILFARVHRLMPGTSKKTYEICRA